VRVNGAPVAGDAPLLGVFPCLEGLAHMVNEEAIATAANSKAVKTLLRLRPVEFENVLDNACFISVFPFVLIFALLHLSRASLFGSCANVFLPGKAEIAVKTRQVFQSTDTAFGKELLLAYKL
jgi:hypothetical protein